MKVACHFTIPEPPYWELDAAVQDGLKIISELGGEINFLYPGKKVRKIAPRFVSGLHQLPKLRRLDNEVDVHHVFSNGFYPYPIYSFLQKPVVVSTVIGLQEERPIKFAPLLKSVKRFIVPTRRDQDIMRRWGYENVSVVVPGIDLSRFRVSPKVASSNDFSLLMGSAPWNESQFVSKGIDVLLQAMQELEWLRVVFLWRGICLEEMIKRIKSAGVADRVSLITKHVNVDNVLADVHGAIVLAQDMQVIKPYPHSILESLAAGKPVIVSKCLQIAEFVESNRCGQIVDELDVFLLRRAIKELRTNYQANCEATQKTPMENFSSSKMIREFAPLYQSAVDRV